MPLFKILAPLDFSDTSPFVLQAAEQIAKVFNGKITPFYSHVPVSAMYANDPFGLEGFSSSMVPNLAEAKEVHQDHLKEVSEKHISEKWLDEPVVSIGSPATTITEVADDYDFVVMGSHGRSGFSRIFMGSVSDKVLRTVHKPVLIVNEEKQLKPVDNIMLTTDFSANSKKAFPLAIEFAKKSEATVTLAHISSYDVSKGKPNDILISKQEQRLDVLAKKELSSIREQLKTKVIVSSANAHEAILNESLNTSYDLIIMATVGHTGIKYLMMGGTTSHVVRHVQTPVISINPKTTQVTDEEE